MQLVYNIILTRLELSKPSSLITDIVLSLLALVRWVSPFIGLLSALTQYERIGSMIQKHTYYSSIIESAQSFGQRLTVINIGSIVQ